MILLIFPPFTKPCEPPASLGQLTGHLKSHHISCNTYDLNIEGLHYLLKSPTTSSDTWTRRALKNRTENIIDLTEKKIKNKDRYLQAVSNTNRLFEIAGKNYNLQLNLSNYQDLNLSPQKSSDLLWAAENFETNIFYPFFKKRLSDLITEHSPQYIGISLNYLSQALCAFAIIGFIKNIAPEIKIILGGGLVTTWVKSPFWTSPFSGLVDHTVSGRGEEQLLKIIAKKESSVRCTPDYSALANNQYLAPGLILPYGASSGCYWKKCSFCPETSEDTPYLSQKSTTVVDQLLTLEKQYKPSLFHLVDSALSPKHMQAIADSKIATPWYSFARLCPELADPTFTQALKTAGCTMLKLGIESGSPSVLEQMNKGIDLQLVSKVLTNLQQTGIATYIYLLFGTPAEDYTEAKKTFDFIVAHHEAVTFLNLSVFNLPICGDSIKDYDLTDQYEGDLSIYGDFIHPKGWNKKKIRHFLNHEFKRHPAISRIIKKNPPFFTSNHAPFFV